MQARDFYDIWYLFEKQSLNTGFYMNEFVNKCKSKGIHSSEFPSKLAEPLPQYKRRWRVSMNDQIRNLPDSEKVEREVQRNFKKVVFSKRIETK